MKKKVLPYTDFIRNQLEAYGAVVVNIPAVKLHAVVADTGGAHEAECVYSVWTTKEKAQSEIKRLIESNIQCGCYNGEFYIVEIKVDEARDEWIG